MTREIETENGSLTSKKILIYLKSALPVLKGLRMNQ